MPFESKSQQRWMFANKPEMAKVWASHTANIKKLPEKKKEEPKKKS
jgi:GMP synthase-like glutamine amidotransferase